MTQEDEWKANARRLVFTGRQGRIKAASARSLSTYLTKNEGQYFEKLYDSASPNEFTAGDLLAVTALSVVVPASTSSWLLSPEGRTDTRRLLKPIIPTWSIETLNQNQFVQRLGEKSNAWRLWVLLLKQRGIGSTIAGKLLAAKRPLLIPISDAYVKDTLVTSERDIWRCMWTILGDEELRNGLSEIRHAVPAAANLSLLRVLDIIAWSHGRQVHSRGY